MVQVGQVLQERYTLKQRLGRTAAGHSTWLASDSQTNEQVTVKLLAFSPQMEWNELKLFEREAEVLQSLNHPRIPRYRDYFDIDKDTGEGMPWFALVQDYIPGSSLQQLLDLGYDFSEEQVRKIATEVLEILVYLHGLNPSVLHRDIKPSNLILGEDDDIHLIDFGAVQAQAAVTGVTFTVVGTSGYAPLEQFWGRAIPASDIYALGATLIHLLTKVAPADLPQKDSRIQFASYVQVAPDLVAWIEKATEIASEKRFGSAKEALDALESREFSYGISNPAIVRKSPKPEGTYIKLHSEKEELKVGIPAPGFRKLLQGGWLGGYIALYLAGTFVYVFLMLLASVSNISLSLAIIYGAIATALAALIAKFFCERTYITFDSSNFNLSRKTLMFRYGFQKGSISNIISVFLNQKGRIYEVRMRSQNPDFHNQRISYKTHNLGGALGEEEALWLVDELRDWIEQHSSHQ